MSHRLVRWSAVAIGVLLVAAAHAFPIPLVKPSALQGAAPSPQVVGNGVYPATTSACYSQPTERSTIYFSGGGVILSAPIVVGVFWPGAQAPDPSVYGLFGDFITDLFNGPYWNAVMPQYVGSAHAALRSSVVLPALLTLAPSTTVHSRYIAAELVAQQKAGVLPAPDSLGNTVYVIHFPPGITITDDNYDYIDIFGNPRAHISIGTSCVEYCAYHDNYLDPFAPRIFPFIVMPDFTQNAACQAGCGSGTPFEIYT